MMGSPGRMEHGSRFSLWARKGIQHLEDLWKEGNRWKTMISFKKITHSKTTIETSWSLLRPGVEVGLTPNYVKGIHIFPLLIVGSFFFSTK
jgi:hypothetical protein